MQAARKLGARTDSELGVDVRQVARDCALAEKQRSGDLLVGEALGHKRGDATFGLGELIFVCRWAASDASQLGTRFGRPQRRGQPVENLVGAFEVRARGGALLGASLGGAEGEESASVLEGGPASARALAGLARIAVARRSCHRAPPVGARGTAP